MTISAGYQPGRDDEGTRSTARWIDIGVNLTHPRFDPDRDRVIARAQASQVVHLIVTACHAAGTQDGYTLMQRFPGFISVTAGIHPHEASRAGSSDWAIIKEYSKKPGVVAIGECGLDYFRHFSAPGDQRRVFENQLILASEHGKALFLHERDAHADFMAMLRDCGGTQLRGVLHCFTGTRDELENYLELGLWIGLTGWVADERRGSHLLGLLSHIPLNRLMLETDAPYLLPRTLVPRPRNGRNEPAFLPHIGSLIAHHLGLATEELARIVCDNTCTFFGIEPIIDNPSPFTLQADIPSP
ncbi:Deoxyribonuclease, TatD Mg-dependent [mine drainage metagenome]|uniref:Deoxyribonuclease, TatD Mg-dependent n=1 Tax=mine drainage metagenome TaxID=410659 RepID=T1D252_9ZZZZ